ncbi:MAG TPA: radical SAM protein [Bacteroidota bacterium]|nr:radical SAM protein [Bacteroidota bacterium]
MTDILLTHSYFMKFDPKQERAMMPYAPLGTLYAASVLEQLHFTVSLFDSMLAASEEEIRSYCSEHRPALVAIYDDDFNYLNKMCLSRMREAAFAMAAIAKEYGAYVVVHGSDATDHAEEYLRHSADAVIVGEGEQTLAEIALQVLGKRSVNVDSIPGIAYRKDGAVARTARRPPTKNLDSIPLPAWHLIDHQRYKQLWKKRHGYYSVNIVTTRGCPFHCNWCAKPIYGQVYNSRSPENVVEEIKLLRRTIMPEHIWFADDIFGLTPGWIEKFSALLTHEGIAIRYKIQSRADLLLANGTVEALARSGCTEVWIGAESGSQKILDAMEKGTTISQIYEARRVLKTFGIKTAFFLQFGYPGEDQNDIESTLRMVRQLMPDDLGISISYPLPGTKFYENVRSDLQKKSNWVDSDDLALMFRGTYSAAYYKKLHRYTHKFFRFWKGIRLIGDLMTFQTSFNNRTLKTVMSIGYFAPAALLDRCVLSYLARR